MSIHDLVMTYSALASEVDGVTSSVTELNAAVTSSPAIAKLTKQLDEIERRMTAARREIENDPQLKAAQGALKSAKTAADALGRARDDDPEIAALRAELKRLQGERDALDLTKEGATLEERRRALAVRDAEERLREIAATLAANERGEGSTRDVRKLTEMGFKLRAEQARLLESLPKLRARVAEIEKREADIRISAERRAIELERIAIAQEEAEANLAAREAEYQGRIDVLQRRIEAEQKRVDEITAAGEAKLAELEAKEAALRERLAKLTGESVTLGDDVTGGVVDTVTRTVERGRAAVAEGVTAIRKTIEDSIPATEEAVAGHLSVVFRSGTKAKAELGTVRAAAEETSRAVAATGEEIAGSLAETTAAAEEAAREYARILKEMTDANSDVFDFAGQQLEEFVTNQREIIERIENTGFGGYLDAFAKAYIKSKDQSLSPDRLVALDKVMQAYIDAIRKYTGEAGKMLDFDTLKRDLDEALKALQGGVAGGALGGSSGLLGKGAPKDCGGSTGGGSFTIARLAGGLR